MVEAGLQAGRGPRQTALDIVGRIGPGGKRQGGIIGLTRQQAEYVLSMRDALGMPGGGDSFWIKRDGKLGSKYSLRDKRYDALVKKAIKEGKPLAKADRDMIAGRYSDRLLKHRGDVVARTETIGALNAGRIGGIRQMVEDGNLRDDQVAMVWDATGDGRTRDSHAAMDGQRVRVGEMFTTPTGFRLAYPGDRSGGAPASEVIQCRCVLRIDVDFIRGLK